MQGEARRPATIHTHSWTIARPIAFEGEAGVTGIHREQALRLLSADFSLLRCSPSVGCIGDFLLQFFSLVVIVGIAFSYVDAFAQTKSSPSSDTIKQLPSKSVEITAVRPSDLPTVDARGVAIKPTSELIRETGSYLASNALEAMSSSLDIREYGILGDIALPSFRGLPPEYTIIYRDGIRVTNEQLGETDLGQLTLHGVSNVDLIPASSAILLGGDAIGSAINLVSEVEDSNTLMLGTEQTMYEGASGFPTNGYYGKFSVKPATNLSIIGGGSVDESTGAFPFYQDSAHPNVLRQNNDAILRSANLTGLWTTSDNTTIRCIGNYFYVDRGVPGAISTEGYGASDFTARQTDAQSFAA
ncbi:MAG TPA: TonB-dependent receptor plug domain-containing protein, partial [Candidatus Kapabacteria bacterium]